MDRREMAVFSAVMRLGSVTAAADALGLAQPSVSKTIALMERRLGFRLFDRVRGRLSPTFEADLVLEEAMRVEGELSRFDRYLDNVRRLRTGQLRVAATPALALALLPHAATIFRRAFPGYGLVLDMQLNHEIATAVERRHYDLGLAVIPTSDESEIFDVVRRGRIVCVLPEQHALAAEPAVRWDQIDPAEFIYVTTDARLVALLVSGIPGFLSRLLSATETNRYTVAVGLARQKLGLTLVDAFTLTGLDTDGIAVRAFEPELRVSLVSVTPPSRPAKMAVRPFLDAIEAVLDADPGRLPPGDTTAEPDSGL